VFKLSSPVGCALIIVLLFPFLLVLFALPFKACLAGEKAQPANAEPMQKGNVMMKKEETRKGCRR